MEVVGPIVKAVKNVLYSFFDSDMDVMDREARRIFSHEEDREKYVGAVEKLRSGEVKSVTITLSTNEEMTLLS